MYPENLPVKHQDISGLQTSDFTTTQPTNELDSTPSSGHIPLHGSLSLPLRDQRSVSPCVQQEGLEIQVGSVLRQKVEMEKKYGGASNLGLTSPGQESVDSNESSGDSKPAYVNEPDIVWNVGTVRQQTEQLEAIKTRSTSGTGGTLQDVDVEVLEQRNDGIDSESTSQVESQLTMKPDLLEASLNADGVAPTGAMCDDNLPNVNKAVALVMPEILLPGDDLSEGSIQTEEVKNVADLVGIFEPMSPELGRRLGKRKGGTSVLKRSKTWSSMRDSHCVLPRRSSLTDVDDIHGGSEGDNAVEFSPDEISPDDKDDEAQIKTQTTLKSDLPGFDKATKMCAKDNTVVTSATKDIENNGVKSFTKSLPVKTHLDINKHVNNDHGMRKGGGVEPPNKRPTNITGATGINQVPMSPEREPDHESQKPIRKVYHGKSHPLSRLSAEGRTQNKLYNTM